MLSTTAKGRVLYIQVQMLNEIYIFYSIILCKNLIFVICPQHSVFTRIYKFQVRIKLTSDDSILYMGGGLIPTDDSGGGGSS